MATRNGNPIARSATNTTGVAAESVITSEAPNTCSESIHRITATRFSTTSSTAQTTKVSIVRHQLRYASQIPCFNDANTPFGVSAATTTAMASPGSNHRTGAASSTAAIINASCTDVQDPAATESRNITGGTAIIMR